MLSTFHLRTFLAVVDEGSYSAAAQRLHMSQPAVSQQIRALEEQLGDVRLFRRVGQRMVPTHAGEELLGSARELVALAERAAQSIIALRGQVTGRVLVGCTPSSGERLLPRLLAAFREQFPAVSVELEVAQADALIDGLGERRLSLLLLEEQQRRRGLESQAIGAEPLSLLAPNAHPLLKQEQVPPGVLREHGLLLPRAGAPLRRLIEESLRRRGVAAADLRVSLEADSMTAIVQGVRSGLGLAFVPKICVPGRGEGLGAIDLAGQPLQQEWYLVRARERGLPRAVQSLYDFLAGPQCRALLNKAGILAPA
ncbi:LysR family transcriptional regulator [Oscillochloris sp. ZM17-4]|uniref:LysR family transcriptional regulator n=1 Tax=Oscillochloris sp. ZM17-4 TaxID=2866714 RepID=UPI001C73CBE2|nr:LysR family transcriptional regulator [Oscillochloris sp. ZM17-4]MBX0327003.1 LysR family transcriptional regulator [Oscillochloris sp. ZM17-4]